MAVVAGSTALYAWIAGPLLRALYDVASGAGAPGWARMWGLTDPTAMTLGLAAVVATAALVRAAANYGQHVLLARLGQDTVRDLRLRLYEHLLRLAPTSMLGHRTGELGSRVAAEVLQVLSLVNMGAASLLRNGVTATALIILAFSLDPPLAAVGLVGLPPIVLLVGWLSKRTRQAHRQAWAAQGDLAGTATETAHMVPVVRAYEGEAVAAGAFEALATRARELSVRAARLRARFAPAMELLGAAAVVIVIVLATTRLEAGTLEPDTTVSLFAALFLLYRPVQALGGVMQGVAQGMAALDRIDELLALDPEPPDPPDAVSLPRMQREIALEEVSFAYGEHPVLEGLSLTVQAGESVAIVGPSGEGKTTLLLVMLGLLRPQTGRVSIDGQDLAGARRPDVRRQFAWVGQEPLLFADTVLRNIGLGDAEPDRDRAERAARTAGIHDKIEQLPNGYDTILEEGGANLSVGERQRVCIARALYRDAPVLVLDEPTAALDGATEQELGDAIDELVADRRHTAVMASHRESTVRRVDRVVVLSQGRIVQQGAPADLRDATGVYRTLFAHP